MRRRLGASGDFRGRAQGWLEKIMKIKLQFVPGLLVVVAVAGCASDKEKIVFSDDAAVRTAAATEAVGLPEPKKLAKADEVKIEQVIFSYLLERHFWDLAEYSAVFVQADDAQVEWLMQKFPGHLPPVKMSYHANLRANQTPLDKDTGKPAMILSADVNEPDADGSVAALGRWYAGATVAGFYTFSLKPDGEDWKITSVQ
jgi:hypothetical protein